jgi:4-hydroxythreonine-4-phosphate dehydrogenase
MTIPRIVISPGEPAGVGPDIVIKIAQQSWPFQLVVVGDANLLLTRADQLGLPLKLLSFDSQLPAAAQPAGTLSLLSQPITAPVQAGVLNTANAGYVLKCLELAAQLCLDNIAQALVTGPIQKSLLNNAGFAFSGHTEHLAIYSGAPQPLMLFVTETTKVALITTHMPLSAVPAAITIPKIKAIIRLLQQELQLHFQIKAPAIYVCGLNPHAGENGHLGDEEIKVIQPALDQLRAEQMNVYGPLPADTIFTQAYLAKADAIVAMYHDQALPVVKYMGFGQAVNVTLGLPFIRTSVDHGTALDVAGTLKADESSLIAALLLAAKLAPASS